MRVSGKNLSLIIDTNVWIDYFMRSEVDAGASERLLEAAILSETTLLVCPTTLKDVFYILPRRFRQQDMREGKAGPSYEPVAWACVERILELATPTPLGLFECTMARSLRDKFGDLEDNLVLASGESAQADYIVTRDAPAAATLPRGMHHPRPSTGAHFIAKGRSSSSNGLSQNGAVGVRPQLHHFVRKRRAHTLRAAPTIEPEGGVPRAKLGFSKCPILTRKRGRVHLRVARPRLNGKIGCLGKPSTAWRRRGCCHPRSAR